MFKHRLRRPSAGLVVAIAALVMTMGGVGYAAGGSDTKSDKKIAKKYFNNHIGGASVSHASSAGSANTLNGVQIVKSAPQPNTASNQDSFTQPCPTGMNVIGGGVSTNTSDTTENISASFPARSPVNTPEPNAWHVDMNNAGASDRFFEVYAICARVNVTSNYTGPLAPDKP